jgi:hypothetical protein
MVWRSGWRLGILAASLLGLAACDSGTSQPGPAEMALATGALDQQLNASADLMRRALATADADKRIFPWELEINAASGTMQVDWWLYDHGYIRVGGVSGSQGYFVLTPKGEALVKGGEPRWLVSSFQGQPQATCAGSQMFVSCRVTASATVAAAPDARDLLADGWSVAPQSFQVVLQKDTNGWSASDFADSATPAPVDAGRLALFGDAKAQAKASYRYALEVNRQVQ